MVEVFLMRILHAAVVAGVLWYGVNEVFDSLNSLCQYFSSRVTLLPLKKLYFIYIYKGERKKSIIDIKINHGAKSY
jgi:hypothetical protein